MGSAPAPATPEASSSSRGPAAVALAKWVKLFLMGHKGFNIRFTSDWQ